MRRGKRVAGPDFTVYYLELSGAPRPRIVVSQKVDKRAVVRNKIRRRLRSILNQILPSSTGLVIIARPSIRHLSYQLLKQKLTKMLVHKWNELLQE